MSANPALANAIRQSPLFSGLSPEQIEAIASIAVHKDFSGGDMIVRQFAKDTDLMVIMGGKARINTFGGEMIAEVGEGAVLGEVSLVDDKPRSATVVSVGGTNVALIGSKQLWNLMDQDLQMARTLLLNISKTLCTRLRAANVQLDGGN
ncbi:MAG: cyclic nucleotide-binding domain-containing protein [Fimbriimonadaceae bacterium]|jgi:CRP-like cAMP-binding protein|nr:cyclic nucleotide-binding domain-containing protein [Fimbriimonadaceae bacterium]